MATITDVLRTVFELVGIEKYVSAMQVARVATEGLAASEQTATAATVELEAALAPEIVGLAAAAAGAITLAASFKQAADDTEQLFQAAIAFRNLHVSLPFEELVRFADELHKSAAVDDEDIVALGGALARLGIQGQQIEPALAAIVNFSQATGRTVAQAGQIFEQALAGRAIQINRELIAPFKATGDRVRDATRLIELLQKSFHDAGQARLGTPLGQLDQLKIAFGDLFSEIGNVFEGLAGPAITRLTEFIIRLTELIQEFETARGIKTAAQRAAEAAGLNPAAGGDPSLRYQRETAEATKATEKLLRQGFNVGPAGRAAFNTRALRAALRGAS